MNSLAVEERRIGLMKRNVSGCQIIINVSKFKRSSNKLHQITTHKDTLDNWNATRPVVIGENSSIIPTITAEPKTFRFATKIFPSS